jgi:FMN phosphatase YigB (HAD superfamily)
VAQCEPEECIFIDDRDINLAPARQLGMATVLAHSPGQVINEIHERLGDI